MNISDDIVVTAMGQLWVMEKILSIPVEQQPEEGVQEESH
jgi:hypothetical protein